MGLIYHLRYGIMGYGTFQADPLSQAHLADALLKGFALCLAPLAHDVESSGVFFQDKGHGFQEGIQPLPTNQGADVEENGHLVKGSRMGREARRVHSVGDDRHPFERDAQAGDVLSGHPRRADDVVGQVQGGHLLVFDLVQDGGPFQGRVVVLQFDTGQAVDLEQGPVAVLLPGLDQGVATPDGTEMGHGVTVPVSQVSGHRLGKAHGPPQEVGLLGDHPFQAGSVVGILGRQGRIASGDHLHVVPGLDQAFDEIGDVGAGSLGAGHHVESGVEHRPLAHDPNYTVKPLGLQMTKGRVK